MMEEDQKLEDGNQIETFFYREIVRAVDKTWTPSYGPPLWIPFMDPLRFK